MNAGKRLPVKLDEAAGALRVDKSEAMDAEAFHHLVRTRNGVVGHDPHDHVGGFRHEADEIPEGVVCCLRLWDLFVGLGLGVYQVGKLDRVLDEEHRHVVADEVEVAFVGVKLYGEAAHVPCRVGRPARAGDGQILALSSASGALLFARAAGAAGAAPCACASSGAMSAPAVVALAVAGNLRRDGRLSASSS